MPDAVISLDQFFVQVINLDRDAGRLKRTGQALDDAGASWTRLPAIAPSPEDVVAQPRYDRQRRYYLIGKDLSVGEMGCFLSHLKALEVFLTTAAPFTVVFEDDVAVDPRAFDQMTKAVALLRDADWDCINLTASVSLRQRQVAMIGPNMLRRSFQFPLLTSGLVWNRKSAKAFLEWIGSVGIYTAVDVQLRDWLSHGARGFSFEPPIFALRDEESTIQFKTKDPDAKSQRVNRLGRYERRQKFGMYARTIWRWALDK